MRFKLLNCVIESTRTPKVTRPGAFTATGNHSRPCHIGWQFDEAEAIVWLDSHLGLSTHPVLSLGKHSQADCMFTRKAQLKLQS